MTVGLVCEFRHTYLDDNRQPQTGTVWDSITVTGLNHPEPLYANAKGQNKLTLPLHTQGDSTLYTLLYHQQLDTICIYHTNQQEFVNMECGCVTLHTYVRLTYTRHWMDSVSILNEQMTRQAETNVLLWVLDN